MGAQSRLRVAGLAGAWMVAATGLWSCSTPMEAQGYKDLRRSISDAARREIGEAEDYPTVITLKREDRTPRLELKPEVMSELDRIAGPQTYYLDSDPWDPDLDDGQIDAEEMKQRQDREAKGEKPAPVLPLGDTLYGTEQKVAFVSLRHVITTAVNKNLSLEFARLTPAISRTQVDAANAAFDWTFFSNFQWSAQDEPRQNQQGIGTASFDQRQTVETSFGVRKPTVTGGQFQVLTGWDYIDADTDVVAVVPDPAQETNVAIQFDQPLLRNAGSEVGLAQVRLAENAERDDVQSLKTETIRTVTDSENAYWQLVQSYMDLKIIQRLYVRGERVFLKLKAREGFDVKPSEIADARAQVESRLADVYRAQRVLRAASDQLKVQMNDPEFPVGSEVLLIPADPMIDASMQFSLIDSVNTALSHRPEIERSIISVDSASVRLNLADNQRLPLLNLRSLMRFSGMGENGNESYDTLTDGQFIDYQVSLQFEQAIGNRAAEAGYSQRMLERMQSVIALRNTVQGVVQEVKSALRDVATNYVLIAQSRTARYAAAENVRTLGVEEKTIGRLTPDFLDLKLRRQQALAAAEQAEIGALVDYNVALAKLHAAMGTALTRNKIDFVVPDAGPKEPPMSNLFPDYPMQKDK